MTDSKCEYRTRNFRDENYEDKVMPCGECQECLDTREAQKNVSDAYPLKQNKEALELLKTTIETIDRLDQGVL